ncbi:zf-HC2 domain-containing protein [Klenkia sp. PcliD-1-E]|uniref:anti-sigma factor n=1 Tax=Klenkia sp. PcliD-1-E TaxID=2954492 RepID=UPI0027E1E4D4|nr:zf-HC2 domain-containing protein [Klenkia sp. PcliD-1-E]
MNIPVSHLAQEAIAALVDGELSGTAAARAARHLSGCAQCRFAVEAQREAKAALHTSREVAVPGDLMSRLQAIPFTADVSSSGGFGGSGPVFAEQLAPQETPQRPGQARWLRRGVAAGLAGIGIGVVALAVNLPTGATAGQVARTDPGLPVSTVGERTEIVPPVVRTVSVGADLDGGTP